MLTTLSRLGLRKILVEYMRYLPIIHAISFTINTSAACSGFYIVYLDFIFALSYNNILIYLAMGIVQNWCWRFKLSLYYLFISLSLSLTDKLIGIPLSNDQYGYMTLFLFYTFVLYYFIKITYIKIKS